VCIKLIVIKKISFLILRIISVFKYIIIYFKIIYTNLDNLYLSKLSSLSAIFNNLAILFLRFVLVFCLLFFKNLISLTDIFTIS
jgi:hypothetical protein